jgi:hypothetical protein
VLDPVSRLGDRFYLGELFRYEGPGFWFGLPLGSQIGFAATMGIMLLALQRLDRDAPDAPVRGGLRDHPHLVALVTYHAQVFHLAAVAFYLDADTLGGAAVLIWVPAAVITAVHWSQLGSGSKHQGKMKKAQPKAEPSDTTAPAVDGAPATT